MPDKDVALVNQIMADERKVHTVAQAASHDDEKAFVAAAGCYPAVSPGRNSAGF